jgi:hypothetical protein
MKRSKLLVLLSVITLGIVACQAPESSVKDIFPKNLNLLQHGVPIAIQVPEDAKVTNRSDNFMQDVVVEGRDYYVQIYSHDATALSCTTLASEALSEIKVSNETFKKVISGDDCGFVYEVQVPGDTTKCYNFAYFRVQGNKSFEYSTTTGRRQPFTLEQVQNMYASMKEQK